MSENATLQDNMCAYVLWAHCEVQYGVDVRNNGIVIEDNPWFLRMDYSQKVTEHL